jgi:hypothetical protein
MILALFIALGLYYIFINAKKPQPIPVPNIGPSGKQHLIGPGGEQHLIGPGGEQHLIGPGGEQHLL